MWVDDLAQGDEIPLRSVIAILSNGTHPEGILGKRATRRKLTAHSNSTGLHRAQRVLALGEFARAAIVSHSVGAVLAVFRRSFYARFGPDAVCFGPTALGHGPMSVLVEVPDEVEWPLLGLAAQQEAWLSGTMIFVADRLRFDFAGAEIWRPPRPPRFSLDDLRAGLRLLCRSALWRSPGGLGAMLVGLDMLPDWPRLSNDLLLQTVRAPMRQIADWLLGAVAREDELPSCAVRSLVGLGPGLTPSGDDFICGLMVALHYLGLTNAAGKIAAAVLPVASRDTNIISAQFLRCAAAGQASLALFDALDAVLTGRNIEQRLDAIDAIGHSSGWDSLAGAALVGAAIAQSQQPILRRRC